MTCNKNGIPFDPEKPMVTSGVRLGTQRQQHVALAWMNLSRLEILLVDVVDGLGSSSRQ